jgi:putative sigma-54 modulation protein
MAAGALEEAADEEISLEESGAVVRRKRFPIKPMTVKDAILEMELLSHDFFLFNNTDSDEYNVLYRRRDGGYGVIEPELG